MDHYKTAHHLARAVAPFDPVICHRPHAATRAARWFLDHFPGKVFYAVKANPDPVILRALGAAGLETFDVASLNEVRLVRALFPQASLAYLHPVKPKEAIAEAYFEHGVKIFSLDSEAELAKIMAATENARDLTLCVRLVVDNTEALMPLSRKFGARPIEAVPLIQAVRQQAERLGVCFHTGSQNMAPAAFSKALDQAQDIVVRSGVVVDVIDVGGGFPARYPGMAPPDIGAFVDAIAPRFERFLAPRNAELWCEPGRALVAEAGSVLLRVEARRGNDLYVNDGIFGTLYDGGHFDWRFPVRPLGDIAGKLHGFSLYGPTCDDADYMKGPFMLPEHIGIGDYFEVGMVGAYGRAMASTFNGFGQYKEVIVNDDPFGSIFTPAEHACRAEGQS